jgi:hypothetical protein
MILAQFELEWYHAAGASVIAMGYGAARIWTTVRKQKQDERREESQTEFLQRSTQHLAEISVKLDHVCKADCKNYQQKL